MLEFLLKFDICFSFNIVRYMMKGLVGLILYHLQWGIYRIL